MKKINYLLLVMFLSGCSLDFAQVKENDIYNRVTEEEWKHAFSESVFGNVTIDIESYYKSFILEDPRIELVDSYKGIIKKTEDKVFNMVDNTEYIYTNSKIISQIVDKGLEVDKIKEEINKNNLELITDGNSVIVNLYKYSYIEYYEKITEDTYLNYSVDSDDQDNLFSKIMCFGYYDDYSLDFSDFIYLNAYSSRTYDARKGAYIIDDNFIDKSYYMEDCDVEAYYYFIGDKISRIEIKYSYMYEGQKEEEINTLVFNDYGTTTITLPSNDKIRECNHEEEEECINETYHYTICTNCYSVLDYEKHVIDNGKCLECDIYI